jgi:hypothetical protein
VTEVLHAPRCCDEATAEMLGVVLHMGCHIER